MRHPRATLTVPGIVLLLSACAGRPAPSAATSSASAEAETGAAVIPTVPLGTPFRLAYDHAVRVGDTGVRLRFADLLEDSRCPAGVRCFQAGRVRVRLEVSPPAGAVESRELSTDADRNRCTTAGVTLELQGVEPPPALLKRAQRPGYYTLTLLAMRGG